MSGKNKPFWAVLAAMALFAMMLAGCGQSVSSTAQSQSQAQQTASSQPEALSEAQPGSQAEATSSQPGEEDEKERYVMVEITMQDGGVIKLQLDREAAPITVANFEKLVNEGFYDGLTFHRAVDGFMIQGGDPMGTGSGGSDEQIKGEFPSNGWDNPLSHKRGVISMARGNNPDSASSQFFITNGDSEFLDANYAAFGTVVEGMDVVDAIAKMPVSGESLVTQPVMEKVVVVADAE